MPASWNFFLSVLETISNDLMLAPVSSHYQRGVSYATTNWIKKVRVLEMCFVQQ